MKELIEDLYLTNRSFITDDYLKCLDYINRNILPLNVHRFPSGKEIWNSWVVPKKWIVKHAFIRDLDGEVILNYSDHPLHLISYSSSYEGYVTRDELMNHLYYHPDLPEAIPWHFRLNYRPWESEWGFCVTKRFVESLNDREYYVSIKTKFKDDFLRVAEHHLEGKRKETIALIAHLDHTGMANDDLSGVAVGLELMKHLHEVKERKYSYKLLLVQEMIGSAAYLEKYEGQANKFKYGIFLEMLGNENRLALQKSFESESCLDEVAEYVLKNNQKSYKIGNYREIVCNDEIIFESPGYEIPTISISRHPYPEYHTHLDNPSIVQELKLEEAVRYVLNIIDILEKDFVPVRNFKGLPSLANPKYNLYIDCGQKALFDSENKIEKMRKFKDSIFRYLEGDYSVFEIAREFEIDFNFVYRYLTKFRENNLIKIVE